MSKFIRKSIVLLAAIVAFYIQIVPVFAQAKEESVYLGGMPAGFVMQMKGVEVIGLSDILTDCGMKSPARDCGMKTGDKIVRFGNETISSANDLDSVCQNYRGRTEIISIEREGSLLELKITPAKELSSDSFRIGVLVRDSISGVGTVTFIKEDGKFAALGHPVYEKGRNLLEISGGDCFSCGIVGVSRGERGTPGELKGAFLSSQSVAEINANTSCGILGVWKEGFLLRPKVETGKVLDVKMGKASIFSTVNGCNPQEYRISIIKVDKDNKENKNFVVKITDKTLLDLTGGIVQGMSGSPIVQNGKLIGAITHVFVNDPTRGYGIAIDQMLNVS